MKHSSDEDVLQTNLLQAFQKNKIMQGKLGERQRLYYVQLLKDMQDHKLKEKLNKELLYTWKKESYVRQLKKNLQEYEDKRYGVRDAYYDYQAKNLECILAGQQGLVIPPSEEDRRVSVQAKFNEFLQKNPLQTAPVLKRAVLSANAAFVQAKQQKEEEDALAVEETWKPIHAQSAVGLRRKPMRVLPSIQRSSTMDEIKRNRALNKTLIPPTVAVVSSVIVTTAPLAEIVPTIGQEQHPSLKTHPDPTALLDGLEPVLITSEILQKQTRADLVSMRSVRRPKKNPIDLNMAFEARKRIYQINKRVYDYQLCHRKCGLQYNSQFERSTRPESADDEENFLVEMTENSRKRYEDRHQADKTFV